MAGRDGNACFMRQVIDIIDLDSSEVELHGTDLHGAGREEFELVAVQQRG